MMPSLFWILFTCILKSAMLQSHPGTIPCWAERSPNNNNSILIYDSDDYVCLNASFGIRLDLIQHFAGYEMDTSTFEGLCEEAGRLAGQEIIGPAILFTWNTTGCSNDTMIIQWQIDDDITYISDVSLSLSNPLQVTRIEYDLRNLHLFETKIGNTMEIKEETVPFGRGKDITFRQGNFKIEGTTGPITLFIIGGIAFGIVITAGIAMYCIGNRKKKLPEEPHTPC